MEGSPNAKVQWKRSIVSRTAGASKAGIKTDVAAAVTAGRRLTTYAEMYDSWLIIKTVCTLSAEAAQVSRAPSKRVL